MDNLGRLAAALTELQARIRTSPVPEGLAFSASGESLRGARMLNLVTAHGELDLTIHPAAFEGGDDDLVGRSTREPIGTFQVRVAALKDVITSKESAGREKDRRALPELRTLAGLPPVREEEAPAAPAAPRAVTMAERVAAARELAARSRAQRTAPDLPPQGRASPQGPQRPSGPRR